MPPRTTPEMFCETPASLAARFGVDALLVWRIARHLGLGCGTPRAPRSIAALSEDDAQAIFDFLQKQNDQ